MLQLLCCISYQFTHSEFNQSNSSGCLSVSSQQGYCRGYLHSMMAIISAFKLFTLITIATISEARVTAQHTVHARAAIANGVSLRILPIGE